jgi:hypothetical protein
MDNFESWTSYPDARMDYPTGRKLDEPPRGRVGVVRVLPEATSDSIAFCSRHWTRAQEREFNADGKVWTDRASGTAYERVPGNPLFAADPTKASVDAWFVSDGNLIFLRRVGQERTTTTPLGSVSGWRAT